MPGRNRQASVKQRTTCADTHRVIEGGIPGGSARHHAGQRRATADRLTLEANWLETIAADQTTMREVLNKLPSAYAVLHDLNVPGSKGTIDHLVVGPGGAFIVVSRRYGEHIEYRDGQLWAGDRSLRSVLEGARGESELLTRSLATPVVPVLAFLDTLLPAATPGVVDGVLVTADEYVVRVITRGAHTLLESHKISDVVERAVPLLHTPGTVPRVDDVSNTFVDSPGLRSVRLPPNEKAATPAPNRRFGAVTPAESGGLRGSLRGSRRSAWGMGTVIAGLCLIAVAIGSLVRLVWTDDSGAPGSTAGSTAVSTPGSSVVSSAGSTTDVPADSSTTGAATAPSTTVPLTNALPAPLVQYSAVCPGPGAGWDLVPTWPGDIEGLAEYDVEMLITESWVSLAGWKNAAQETSATLRGQPANATYTVRMTAVLADGSRSVSTPTPVVAPAETC